MIRLLVTLVILFTVLSWSNGFLTLNPMKTVMGRSSLISKEIVLHAKKKNANTNINRKASDNNQNKSQQQSQPSAQIQSNLSAVATQEITTPSVEKPQISDAVLEKIKEDKAKNPTLDVIAMQKALTEYAESTSAKTITTKKGFGSSTAQAKITKEQWFEEYEKVKKEQELSPAKETKKNGEGGAFGEKVLERFPPAQLKMIDNMLVGATFFSLSIVIAIGVGLSLSSLTVSNSGFQLDPVWVDFINNKLYPSFTPAIGVLFLCSITFGIFKFAQVSSNKTLYTED